MKRVAALTHRVYAAITVTCLSTLPAHAQQPFTPGVAFGAAAFPDLGPANSTTWALQFDLFTELSKDLELPSTAFQRYNEIDKTIGVNQVGVTWSWHNSIGTSLSPVWHPSVWAAGGVIWDGATEFLQNDFAHGLRLLTYVPRDGVANHVVFGVGTDQALTIGGRPLSWFRWVGMLGGGAGLSTTFQDLYTQSGLRLGLGSGARPWLELGVLGRYGGTWTNLSWGGFRDGLGGDYVTVQPFLAISSGLGRLQVAYGHHWGPWFDKQGDIVERLWSVRIEDDTATVGVEMWNDFIFKDLGPTFGLRLYWRRGL